MSLAVTGTLVAPSFLEHEMERRFRGRLGERTREDAYRRYARWRRRATSALGPASGVTAVVDVAAAPLFALLGFGIRSRDIDLPAGRARLVLVTKRGRTLPALVHRWGEGVDRAWQHGVRSGATGDAGWCLWHNGVTLRLVDTRRTWSRRYVDVDLDRAAASVIAFAPCWALVRAEAFDDRAAPPLHDALAAASERHRSLVRADVQRGVEQAVATFASALGRIGRSRDTDATQEALTLAFRLLFLLYAEARHLVPMWHPTYRTAYSVGTLAKARSARGGGLWPALQAIARLARTGCRVGSLRVTAFNGPLFAREHAPAAERVRLSDDTVRAVLTGLTTRRPRRGGPSHAVSYEELDVDQLGGVYESLLDTLPRDARRGADGPAAIPGHAGVTRKNSGTYYTPRPLTEYLVRRTLAPLVRGRSAGDILRLRVLDPSMGSGAMLVAACRWLAAAYEDALVREHAVRAGDVTAADRAAFRRLVAQRCLFGVDLNPMAVQLARLSLWLVTLAADAPLTFLDHRLRTGDSLVGASLDDVARQPPGGRTGGARARPLPLFADDRALSHVAAAVGERTRLAEEPDVSPAVVHDKARRLERLTAADGPLAPAKALADLWCAVWMWTHGSAPDARTFADLAADLAKGRSTLPDHVRRPWLDESARLAASQRFFHWSLEFPEVFSDARGHAREDAGFDAILGNPPWDMVRADTGTAGRADVSRVIRFVREAGIYVGATGAHLNRYQLFVERALSLLRPGGRIGLVLPWGAMADHGAVGLRRALFDRATLDALVSIDNGRGVFPIHRSLTLLLLTGARGGRTIHVRCRLGEQDVGALDALPDEHGNSDHFPVLLHRSVLERIAGDTLAVPRCRSGRALALAERLFASHPALGSAEGWHVRFSRELNATDDRPWMTDRADDGLPVVEGRHIRAFGVDLGQATRSVPRDTAARLLPGLPFLRRRLAFRDVASASNRVTVIAARLPAGTVSTHTLLCLRDERDDDEQAFLCGLLNSYVFNFLARLWVQTHVTAALVERLPAPRPSFDGGHGGRVVEDVGSLERGSCGDDIEPRLQAAFARLYGLTRDEFAAVLDGFPLVAPRRRGAALDAFGTSS